MTNKYYIKQLSDYIYLINDDTMCSTYVVIGYKNALIIDAGIASNKELLLPLIKKITNLPIKVVITHAHLDHIGHLYEFDNYYIAKEELDNIKDQAIKEKAIIISDGFMFDLGGISIETYISKGHTTASTLFIDKDNKIVFTGDQFGSGCGVWMQVNEAYPLSIYVEEIDRFLNYLSNVASLSMWTLYGGHYGQEETGRLGYNPLNTEMVKNLKELSIKLIGGEVSLLDSNAKSFNNEKSYYASYKNAEMIIRKSLIK